MWPMGLLFFLEGKGGSTLELYYFSLGMKNFILHDMITLMKINFSSPNPKS